MQASARAGVRLRSGAIEGKAAWRLWYRLPDERASFRVQVDDGETVVVDRGSGFGAEPGQLSRSGSQHGQLTLTGFSGAPQLLGAVVESDQPGVVLDTLGINGARAATPLAWDPTSWVELVAARAPELAVLAYGTNEVFWETPVERYTKHYTELLSRLRRARGDLECLMVGPTDVAKEDGSSHPRVALIDAQQRKTAAGLGCAYFSLYRVMGGEGGFRRWAAANPPLGGKDRVHLTARGYARLGRAIAESLLAACD
jgi:lysophospholipase L1-like esterase